MADNTQIFFDEVKGKFIDFDGVYGAQCKDLVQKYVTECRALPPLPKGDAWEMYDKAPNKIYTKILNTPKAIPKKGDIIIWKKVPLYLPYGHIAIFNEGNVNRFSSMDQNWPTKSPCHIQQHNYRFIKGWIRPK